MPSPWKDRKRFYDAALYLDACGERLLGRLTDYLNAVHGISKPARYWRILIGPWLFHYLHAAYDRYVHLTEALAQHPDLQTITLDPKSFKVPKDTRGFVDLVIDDPFNLQIFSQILKDLGYAFQSRTFQHGWPAVADGPAIRGLLQLTKRVVKESESLAGKILGRVSAGRWQVGVSDLGCPRSDLWGLAWRMGLRVLPWRIHSGWSFPTQGPCFDDRRKSLHKLPASDEFERLVVHSLPENFPILYLESFQEAREETISKAGMIPKVLVSEVGWYWNEPFKFMAAEAVGRGCRLVTVQHGGGYGIFRFSAAELHETRLGDTFMAWGWADQEHGNCRNLPSPKLSSFVASRRLRAEGSDRILFVLTAHMPYLLRFHSGVRGEEYFHWQVRFLEAMPLRLRRFTVVRPYLEDYGHRTRERLTERFGVLQWDGSKSFLHSLRASRLAVFDHSGTTFLEALRLNVPTILYWDSHLTEVRGEAASYFEDLRKVGILWDSPEAAAAKVEEIYDDPWAWWGSTVVQEARQIFVDRFAFGRKDWVNCWVKALEEEMALSQIKEQ